MAESVQPISEPQRQFAIFLLAMLSNGTHEEMMDQIELGDRVSFYAVLDRLDAGKEV